MDKRSCWAGFGGSGWSKRVMGECLVDSGCHKLSENIWFVWSSMVIPWSRTPYSGEKVGCDAGPRTDGNVKIELEF